MKLHYRRNFTLIELIAVIAILGIAVGVIISRANRIPAFLTLETSVNKVRELFLEGSNQSLARGEEVVMEYDPGSKTLRIVASKDPFEEDEELDIPDDKKFKNLKGGLAEKKYRKLYSYTFPAPNNFQITFPNFKEDEENPGIRYYFYSDGSADGPTMQLDFKGHTILISISPLTGMINVEEVVEDEEV